MSGFKEPGFTDRQKASQNAKQSLLNKFRAQPGPDDPEVAKRRAEREAVAAKREAVRTSELCVACQSESILLEGRQRRRS